MGGNNLESLLMGDNDSSSGESDGEDQVNLLAGGTAAAAVAAVVPPPEPPPVVPAPAAPAAPAAGGGQLDQMARLKSLYQQQPKRQAPAPNSNGGSSTPQTSNRSIAPPPQQQQHQQQMPQLSSYQQAPPPHSQQHPVPTRPLPSNRPHPQAAPHQQPHPYQQPPPPTQQQQQQQQQQYHHSAISSSQSRTMPPPVVDPFAPTPLHRIKEQQQMQQHHQHVPPQPQAYQHALPQKDQQLQQQQQPSVRQGPPPPQDRAAMERAVRHQKEKFLMFTRVLIKYLEQKDPKLHQQAKMIIKDCADRNKRQEPGFESVTSAMRDRLKALVGENYWKRAEIYLKHFLDQKKKQQQEESASGTGGAPPGSTTSSASRAQQHQQAMQEKQRKMQQMAQQQNVPQQNAPQQQQQQQQQAATTPTMQQVQRDIASQKAKVSATAPATGGGKGKSVAKKAVRRKSTGTAAASRKASSASSLPPAITALPKLALPKMVDPSDPDNLPPREYNELMKMLDHAIDFDWATAGFLLGSKTDLQLTDEQQNLLYGDLKGTRAQKQPADEETTSSATRPGWSGSNIVSARNAWAAVRLRELKLNQKTMSSLPVVGDVGLTLPQASKSADAAEQTSWINEDHAEDDVVLAMLSEGTEIFLRRVLEKAIKCARQRQNLDGIRLWHQQSLYAAEDQGEDSEDEDVKKTKKPALSLRLGCDVERQEALVVGNAAMTVKRMEQALERQSGVPARARVLEGETLEQATSMSDLAMRPQLGKGVDMADHHAKRQYEIYGGKDAMEPPLGRVPKKARLEAADFMMGSLITESVGRHRARNAAASIHF